MNHTARRIADWVGILVSQALRSVRHRVENSASSSQVWHGDDNPCPSTERSGRDMNLGSRTGRPVRGVQNQLTEDSVH